jgi:hypothetical protein
VIYRYANDALELLVFIGRSVYTGSNSAECQVRRDGGIPRGKMASERLIVFYDGDL